MMRISILDQSPIAEQETAIHAFQKTVQLAQFADEENFHRFWVSEHHNFKELAGSAPEAIIPYLLAKTNRIRIGSGGVMLQHYPAFKVAEVFNVLASLEPNRVDLGIGKAPGGTNKSTEALQGTGSDGEAFESKLADLLHFLRHTEEEAELVARPFTEQPADVFLLGGSSKSAELAAIHGITYVFASFINSNLNDLRTAFEVYNQSFQGSQNQKPQFIVAVGIIVADTDEEARALNKYPYSFKVHVDDGRTLNVTTYERAAAFGESTGKSYWVEKKESGVITGSIQTVEARLEELTNGLDIDELIVHVPIPQFEEKRQTLYQLKQLSLFQQVSNV
ncbi:MsnO8 family LLM class oxidoreductase [Alkalicoccobacillus murimartini]|uniref:Luciferase family oxidoreductase group 1 n=1 Tax=Alkalicoccobacillus murimartini TaxID=171685 RepID=A0ABT9YG82_9BACI|nr:MsnO8 family LLM class oxidoreductase [Alkalicoccobacillus murimartini]MDQ0206852.1 luciferase family oxidoreductase group 1 [Alkalicoccobacillus murimartini]